MANENREFRFEITEALAVLGEHGSGWNRELNMVRWNDLPPKYDLRDWNGDHTKCGKGITLSEDEMKRMLSAVSERF